MPEFELIWNDETLKPEEFEGFFVGWPNPPSPEVAYRAFKGASEYCLARVNGELVGFITVFTDGFYIAYIPLLEVRPDYQRRGIGKALVRAAVERYKDFYKLDVLCDLRSVLFYQQLGFQWVSGATLVNLDRQSTGRT
jgi:ribosomal protein S18 acetylase RimI-like enzyme